MKAVVYAKCVLVKSFEVADAIEAEEAALHDLIDGELDGWDLTADNEIVRIEDEYGGVAEEYHTNSQTITQRIDKIILGLEQLQKTVAELEKFYGKTTERKTNCVSGATRKR